MYENLYCSKVLSENQGKLLQPEIDCFDILENLDVEKPICYNKEYVYVNM